MRKFMLMVLAVLALTPLAASAMEVELRVKGGSVPGVDTLIIDNPYLEATGDGDRRGNAQVEVTIAPLRSRWTPVFSVGAFSRSHSGTVSDVYAGLGPTKIEYDAAGLNLGAGARFRFTRNFHMDVKLEFGLGSGDMTLTTPGFIWNQTKDQGYSSTSLLVGGYYTIGKHGPQLGVELGAQDFYGDFEIWNNGGYWSEGYIEGTGAIVNMVLGFRF